MNSRPLSVEKAAECYRRLIEGTPIWCIPQVLDKLGDLENPFDLPSGGSSETESVRDGIRLIGDIAAEDWDEAALSQFRETVRESLGVLRLRLKLAEIRLEVARKEAADSRLQPLLIDEKLFVPLPLPQREETKRFLLALQQQKFIGCGPVEVLVYGSAASSRPISFGDVDIAVVTDHFRNVPFTVRVASLHDQHGGPWLFVRAIGLTTHEYESSDYPGIAVTVYNGGKRIAWRA